MAVPPDSESADAHRPVPVRARAGAGSAGDVEERALLERAAGGDQVAFRRLVERHAGVLHIAAGRLLGPAGEADDIVQEAFLRLWRNAADIEVGAEGVRPWLRRVVRNLAIDRIRQRRPIELTEELPDVPQPAPQLVAIGDVETARRVRAALDRLPERQRAAIVLFHFEEASQQDIAAAFGLSQDAVESLLARGRRRLKELLRDDWRALLEPLAEIGQEGT